MPDPAPPPPAADDSASRLPRHTTPTWEVELLISGVAVFAMLQLPGWLDDTLFALEPRFEEEWGQPLRMIYVYLKSATLILAATFSIHLLLRAQWIAQVGMHSVFPDGIRWDRLRMGPVQREIEVGRYGGPTASIERADNRATILFSIGVMLASTLLVICLFIACLFTLVLGVAVLIGIKTDINLVLGYSTLAVFLPLFLAIVIDRSMGSHLSRDGAMRRMLAAVLGLYNRTGIMQRASNPTFSLLSSHGGEHRATLITVGAFLLACTAVFISIYTGKDSRNLGNYDLFPSFSDDSHALDGAHYDDQRNPARDPAVPFIDSAIASQPYLRVVVPYRPDMDASMLRRDCPTALALEGDARAAKLLDCLQRAHAAVLDGKPLASLRYEIGSDARTDRPALIAMVDLRALAPGRHELRVARAAEPGDDERKDKPKTYWTIPFWR